MKSTTIKIGLSQMTCGDDPKRNRRGMELLLSKMSKTKTNSEFLSAMQQGK